MHSLAWLAHQLSQHGQTEFYLERMQPDWLPESILGNRYHRALLRLTFGIEIFVSAAIFAWLRGGWVNGIAGVGAGLLGLLGSGAGNHILGWMAPGLGGGLEGGGSLGILLMLVSVLVKLLMQRAPLPSVSRYIVWHGLRQGLRSGLLIATLVGLFSGGIFSLSGGVVYGLSRGVVYGLFSGLVIGLMMGLVAGLSTEEQRPLRAEQHITDRLSLFDRLLTTLFFSLCAGLGFGSIDAWFVGEAIPIVLLYGSVVSLFYGIAFGIAGGTKLLPTLGRDIHPAESVAWSWSMVGYHLVGILRKGLLLGLGVMVSTVLPIGCASALFHGLIYGLRYGLIYSVIISVVAAVAAVLTEILSTGWSTTTLSEQDLFRPNEGMHRSLKHALFAASLFGPFGGVVSGLVCGATFGLVAGLSGWPILTLGFTIVFGLLFTLQFFLMQGGIAVIEHYLLRWYLWREGMTIWNYVRFLDYAAERILLRKVGGGYLFAHRLLLDYFASLSARSVTSPAIPSEQASRSEYV